jgi:zinc transporter ZupT
MLNFFVAKLLGGHSHRRDNTHSKPRTKKSTRESVDARLKKVTDIDAPTCCALDPVEQLVTIQRMASVLQHELAADAATPAGHVRDIKVNTDTDVRGGAEIDEPDVEEDFVDNLPLDPEGNLASADFGLDDVLDATVPIQGGVGHDDECSSGKKLHEDNAHDDHENKKLVKMGLNTALAIGLHNFPEGTLT